MKNIMKILICILITEITMANANILTPNKIEPIITDQYKCITKNRIRNNLHFHELNCYLLKNLKKRLWYFHANLPKSNNMDHSLKQDSKKQTYFFEFVKIENENLSIGLAYPPFTKYTVDIKTGKTIAIGFWRTTESLNQ